MFLDRTDVLIIEELSRNSRVMLKTMAEHANVSIKKVGYRLKNLEKKLGIHYTIEPELTTTGLPYEFLVRAKLNAKPDVKHLRELLLPMPNIQFAALADGDFDLFMWGLAPSSSAYSQKVEPAIRAGLEDYLSEWNAHPLLARRAGFFPVDNALISTLAIRESRRKVLRILNENSRIQVINLAEMLGVEDSTAEYHLKRARPFIRRFTAYFEGRGDFLHIARFLQLRGKGMDFQVDGRRISELYLKNDPRLFNRLVYAATPSGGFDTFLFENFTSLEDHEAFEESIKSHHNIIGKHESAKITKVLKGAIPIRKVDLSSECKYLLSPAEVPGD